ncbi:hypothetical protein ACWD64_37020 [Streptomyces antibioticus]|nr:hypothetical protein [Streptomyces sp. S9]
MQEIVDGVKGVEAAQSPADRQHQRPTELRRDVGGSEGGGVDAVRHQVHPLGREQVAEERLLVSIEDVAPGLAPGSTTSLIGAIGRAELANLHPEQCRQRLKARYRKTFSKYQFQRDQHPRTVQTCALDFKMVKGGDIDAGPDG